MLHQLGQQALLSALSRGIVCYQHLLPARQLHGTGSVISNTLGSIISYAKTLHRAVFRPAILLDTDLAVLFSMSGFSMTARTTDAFLQ